MPIDSIPLSPTQTSSALEAIQQGAATTVQTQTAAQTAKIIDPPAEKLALYATKNTADVAQYLPLETTPDTQMAKTTGEALAPITAKSMGVDFAAVAIAIANANQQMREAQQQNKEIALQAKVATINQQADEMASAALDRKNAAVDAAVMTITAACVSAVGALVSLDALNDMKGLTGEPLKMAMATQENFGKLFDSLAKATEASGSLLSSSVTYSASLKDVEVKRLEAELAKIDDLFTRASDGKSKAEEVLKDIKQMLRDVLSGISQTNLTLAGKLA